jgi:predicted 3-demethylubiquinone-9 3-methyltransferase (glyoxalase superfamily)
MPRITPNLWFDGNVLEAAEFYASVFPNSSVGEVTYYGADAPLPQGTVLTVNVSLDGQPLTIINGGPQFTLDEACSLLIDCADQAEIDYYWDALTADGGEPGPCGWCKDKFGVSWQVVPAGWETVFAKGDDAATARAMKAMYGMQKLDVAALHAAYDGKEA